MHVTYILLIVMCVTWVENNFKQVEHIKSNADDHTLDNVAIFVES